jgi:hypothetical protein
MRLRISAFGVVLLFSSAFPADAAEFLARPIAAPPVFPVVAAGGPLAAAAAPRPNVPTLSAVAFEPASALLAPPAAFSAAAEIPAAPAADARKALPAPSAAASPADAPNARVGAALFDGSRASIERDLIVGEPSEVEAALERMRRLRPAARTAVLARAESAVRRRIAAAIPRKWTYAEDERTRLLDAYDDVLRLLKLRGVLSGRVIYPLIGPDMLPARWTPTFGMNWTDHRRAFADILRGAGRRHFSAGFAEAGRLAIARVESFSAKSLRRALRRVADGPRTLILKFAFPYCIDAENRMRGLLTYCEWLALLARESVAVGDHVVVMGGDAKTFAYFDSSRSFRRVPLSLPALARADNRDAGFSYGFHQALYFPNNLRVYRKTSEVPEASAGRGKDTAGK